MSMITMSEPVTRREAPRTEVTWLNETSRKFMTRGYVLPGVSPEARLWEICEIAEKKLGMDGFAKQFYEYAALGYYSLSTPIWANFGLNRGLPISCFSVDIGDSMSEILYSQSEVGMMSKFGGGTGGYFGNLRGRGAPITNNGRSSGAVHFMQLYETLLNVVSQGSTRRGSFAAYLPITHPDINEFLEVGTEGNPIQIMTTAVTVSDKFMREMIDGDVTKRAVWAKVLQRRSEMGYPYVFFEDTVNRDTVDVYKDKGLKIRHSNLCAEICLPTNHEWSFVCDLSSMNILHYDEWKDTDAVKLMVCFLDAVMTDFIEKLEALRDSGDAADRAAFHFMKRAYNFAVSNRALGLGGFGWHSYLQSKMVPFASMEAKRWNVQIFKTIQQQALEASRELAVKFGEPSVLKGYGRRNTTLTAVAPTTSSAFIIGQASQSIEPIWSNCYVKDLAKAKVSIYNPKLKEVLAQHGRDDRETWNSIRDRDGSVQHLDFLSSHEREVFRTFCEIDQAAIIEQAAARQQFIDQGQSLNLMINPKTKAKDINSLMIYAWQLGVKSLYYQHSTSAAQDFNRSKMCVGACEA